jgi:tetratricopeptide (TPR) repeat protein
MTRQADETKQGHVPPELAARLASGQITLGEFAGLPRQTLYAIAEIGYQMLGSGKLAEAQDIYRGLVAADPYDSVFHCHLGATLHRQGQLDAASDEYTKALQFNKANLDALVGRGEIHLQQQRLSAAIGDLHAAIELDPQGRKASTVRARAILLALKEAAGQANAMSQNVREQ